MANFGWTTNVNQSPTFPLQPSAGVPNYPGQPGAPPFPGYPTLPQAQSGTFHVEDGPMLRVRYGDSYAAPVPPREMLRRVSDTNYQENTSQGAFAPAFYWVESSIDQVIPRNAVESGTDVDGSKIYVGLAVHDGDELPAKVIPEKHAAYVPHGGKEYFVKNYKVLCENKLKWVLNSGGKIPDGAVPAGRTKSGETLYIGRTKIEGSITNGKVHPSLGRLFVPFGGEEHSFTEYEILVIN